MSRPFDFFLVFCLLIGVIDAGANIDHLPATKLTAVGESAVQAIRNGNLAVLSSYMTAIIGSPLEAIALNTAVKYEQTSIVGVLLHNGVDPQIADPNDGGKMPLHHAAENGDIGLINLLIKYGAQVDASSTASGLTPLISAVMMNSLEAARVLIELGADINKTDNFGNSALHFAIGLGNVDMVLLLLNRRAFVDPKRDLYYAASIANISNRIVVALLNHGADVNTQDKIGRSPLYYAVRYKNIHLVRLFLQRGADPNLGMNGCNAPLFLATSLAAGLDIVRVLVDHGASVEIADCTGRTPLQVAEETRQNQPEVFKFLQDVANGNYLVAVKTSDTDPGATNSNAAACSCCSSGYQVSVPTFEFERQQGVLRFEYIKDDPAVNLLSLHFNINRPLNGIHAADFNMLLQPTVLEGLSMPAAFRFTSALPLQPGDTINYWLMVIVDKKGYAQLTDQIWTNDPNEAEYYPRQLRLSSRKPYASPTKPTTPRPITTTTAATTTTQMTTARTTRTTTRKPTTTTTKWSTIFPTGPTEDVYLNLTWIFG